MQELYPESIFDINSVQSFNAKALEIFHFQKENNAVYNKFLHLSGQIDKPVQYYMDIPFIPISCFKHGKVLCGNSHDTVFTSSGTGGVQSKHFVKDLKVYNASYQKTFNKFFGDVKNQAILCLLPSYAERTGSSLIYMAEGLVAQSEYPESGFFLYDHQALYMRLNDLAKKQVPTILLGVSFALTDFVDQYTINHSCLKILETGGMKGRKAELTRTVLHEILTRAFNQEIIYSEYGMTELLSQAYTEGGDVFYTPSWMKVIQRDLSDPMAVSEKQGRGGLNVIDLANIHSCSFIATDDACELMPNGGFKVLGRIDNSDVRGCNLMVSDV